MKPRYTHDCSRCVFLGQLQEFDIYACPQGGHPTIVARFSKKPGDYFSGERVAVAGLHVMLSYGWDSEFKDPEATHRS